MTRLNRRNLIAGLLGMPLAALPGCSPSRLPQLGELLSTSFGAGHQIRDGLLPRVEVDSLPHVPVVIVGGGIAGLSSAWRMKRAGFSDFLLLELEDQVGGTSQGGRTDAFSYPWGAHYIPAPMRGNHSLIRLLEEMEVVERLDAQGSPIIYEQFLCRDPEERLFFNGTWQEGIYPYDGATQEDLRQLSEFRSEVDHWVEARDEQDRRMFAVPMSTGSDGAQVRALDRISMASWLDQHGWDSPRLRWLVDYGCRDDYGLPIDQVSAWAGLFYFASRVPAPGFESQPVITWPDGNGRVVRHFVDCVAEQIRCSTAVSNIRPALPGDSPFDGSLVITALDRHTHQILGWRADKVIFAAPQMLAKHVIRDLEGNAVRKATNFRYGSWLVANVHLQDRPAANGFAMCWDNVIHGSRSLGYVTSTHQRGIDHGPTVLTWYHPFADSKAAVTRQQMLELSWSDWAEVVMGDLLLGHPDLGELVSRIDVKLWGHAMIQPHTGFVWSEERIDAAQPFGSIHFSGTDLSGIALFEEAFYHGNRAAEEVMDRIDYDHDKISPNRFESTT